MKSKSTPIIIAILIPLISIAAALGLLFLKKSGISTNPEFEYSTYVAAPKNLAGNRYALNAELEMQLANIGGDRVVSLRDSDGNKFAVYIPALLKINAQTKQRYEMDVKIGSKGEIVVESMRKF